MLLHISALLFVLISKKYICDNFSQDFQSVLLFTHVLIYVIYMIQVKYINIHYA